MLHLLKRYAYSQWEETVPRIEAITPAQDRLAGGASVTISGRRFAVASDGTPPTIKFGTAAATNVVVIDRYTITAVAPAGVEGTVNVSLTNDHGQVAILTGAFSYIATKILDTSPHRGHFSGGTTVLISGVNFTSGMSVTFGGTAATSVVFIDSSHISAVTPAHAVGPVTVVVGDAALVAGFYYTLLIAGEDIRRLPGVQIHETLGGGPNTASFRIDGNSAPPKVGSEVSIVDGAETLFAGIAADIDTIYEGLITQLAWDVRANDFVAWLNRRSPTGSYVCTSITDIVKNLIARYAPWITTNHVQTGLPFVTVSFDGTHDFAAVLTSLAQMMGPGHWYLDYTRDLHFFKTVLPSIFEGFSAIGATSGLASAPTLPRSAPTWFAESSQETPGYSITPSYIVIAVSFVYSSGAESALGKISNCVFSRGRYYVRVDDLPIGSSIGGLTVTGRRLYFGLPKAGGSIYWTHGADIDNSVTSYDLKLEKISSRRPAAITVAPPAAPTSAPQVSQDDAAAYPWVQRTMTEGSWSGEEFAHLYTFTPGDYIFAYTNVYEDGTESQPSPDSDRITLNGLNAVEIRIQSGDPVNGLNVVFRKVYASLVGGGYELWSSRNSGGWDVIPHNDNDASWKIIPGYLPGVKGSLPPGRDNTLQCPSNEEGPSLEDPADNPADITDANFDLLRDQQVVYNVNVTQVRNRVTVRGASTTVATTTAAGALNIPVTSTVANSPMQGSILLADSGLIVNQIGVGTDTLTGLSVIILSTPLPVPLVSGQVIRPVVTLDHVGSQRLMGDVEREVDGSPGDGIHEVVINDQNLRTQFSCYTRARAEIESFGLPIVTVNYATRDRKSHPGRLVNFDLSRPPIKGTFLIQEVSIDQIHEDSDELTPRFTVRASSVRFDLEDLLMLITGYPDLDASVGSNNLIGVLDSSSALVQGPAGVYQVGQMYLVTVILSATQLRTLFSTPITVASGQAGMTLVPYSLTVQQRMGAQAFNVGPSIGVTYTEISGYQALAGVIGISNAANELRTFVGPGNNVSLAMNFNTDGKGLMLYGPVDRTGGSGTFRVSVAFMAISE